jgi:iron complex outermembrane receptor protein
VPVKPFLPLVCAPALLLAQATGTLRGRVTLDPGGEPLHDVDIHVGDRETDTGADGTYEITGLAPGVYTVLVHLQSLSDQSRQVVIAAGQSTVADFVLRFAEVRESVTVTASGREQSTFEAFQTVTTVDSLQLALQARPSLGEAIQNQPGVAKRSFGPGNSRPVIRGFDGDRVLVMQDGMPTGAISSQSGDHGESIDPSNLESIEVLKGPATLLYGSTAIGGVVNAVTGRTALHDPPHPGVHGSLTGYGGTTNAQGGGSANFDVGLGPWLIWGSGSGQRTGDYGTPIGTVPSSGTRTSNSSGGFGWYGDKRFADASYRYDEGRYGVPFAKELEGAAEDISLAFHRHNLRVTTGWQNGAGVLPAFRLSVNYSGWQHKELEGEEPVTVFNNKLVSYRGVFEQRPSGPLSGSFGFQGLYRDFKTAGEEALAPPVTQRSFAVFGLEELTYERLRFQFGARVENNAYNPVGLPSRSFTGFSGAAGIYVPFRRDNALVINYTYSYRAPALEELYNNGPHVGNITFELGDPNLRRERSRGIEVSYRRRTGRMRRELSYFRYDIDNFVYLAATGEVEDGLPVARYAQARTRYWGFESSTGLALHPNFELMFGFDYVNAGIKSSGTPLPRIPPARGRAGFEFRKGGFRIQPQAILTNRQKRVYVNETPTAGYVVFGFTSSYTWARQHVAHIAGVEAFNLGDVLYRNHLSFIKDRAPEIGRGVRFTYTVRFF